MKRRLIQGIGAVLLVLTAGMAMMCGGCGSQTPGAPGAEETPKVLRIGAIPSEDAEKTKKDYAALLSYLEKKTGLKTELFVATDYTGVVEAMRSKKIDIAMFGPFSYVMAADQANAEAFVVEKKNGTTTYKSVIIANPASGYKNLSDLQGKTFAFVDPASTSGNLMPRYMMKKQGLDADSFFGSVTYAGGHDAVALAVKNKSIDGGATNDLNLQKMEAEGIISKADYVVLMQSDPIPGSPWAYRKDLPDDLKNTLIKAFTSVATEAPEALQSANGKLDGYEATGDPAYNIIRETAKILDLNLATMK